MTVYGALLVGGTGFLTETTPTYPDAGRYWDMTQRHRFTQVSRLPCRVQGLGFRFRLSHLGFRIFGLG